MATIGTCAQCGADMETPLACGACGLLAEVAEGGLTPFEALGIEPTVAIDERAMRKRLRRFARLVHPDFFTAEGGRQLELAEEHNARLNDAYEIVSDDARRIDFLVRHLGGPAEKDLGCMPQAFLMEVMEWNETLDEHEAGSEAFAALETELESERATLITEITRQLTPLPEHGADVLKDVRKSLNALRYIDRALTRVARQTHPTSARTRAVL